MTHYVLKTSAGERFIDVANAAKSCTSHYDTVEFEFNGIKCLVNKETVIESLERDYTNAHVMGWKQIGPNCATWYDTDTEIELYTKKLANAKERKEQEIEIAKKDKAEKAAFEEKVKGVSIELKDETDWLVGKNKNTDPYGSCIYEYAEGWAKLMQIEMAKGVDLKDCASTTSYEVGFLGITGYMYGAAVSILSHCWKYGEELRKWHNKEYNHEGDGVVNPAILTVKE